MHIQDLQNLTNHEHLRMETYRLLADGYHLPRPDLGDNLSRLEACLQRLGSSTSFYRTEISLGRYRRDDIEALKIDYARLFVGPFTLLAPPYGSVYLEGERRVMGASTAEVQRRYQEAGINVADDFKDPPDHIAAELEFMHFLIFKELEAIGRRDHDSVVSSLFCQKSFLEDHLGAWIMEFAGNVVEHAETGVYRNLARVTADFVKADYQVIISLSAEWPFALEDVARADPL